MITSDTTLYTWHSPNTDMDYLQAMLGSVSPEQYVSELTGDEAHDLAQFTAWIDSEIGSGYYLTRDDALAADGGDEVIGFTPREAFSAILRMTGVSA